MRNSEIDNNNHHRSKLKNIEEEYEDEPSKVINKKVVKQNEPIP
jgi:hypothetical protein